MIDLTRLTKKSGDYAFGPRAAVTDRVLMEVAEQYEIEVTNRFIAIKPADLPARYGPDSRVLSTTKYDGEGVFVYFEAGKNPENFHLQRALWPFARRFAVLEGTRGKFEGAWCEEDFVAGRTLHSRDSGWTALRER